MGELQYVVAGDVPGYATWEVLSAAPDNEAIALFGNIYGQGSLTFGSASITLGVTNSLLLNPGGWPFQPDSEYGAFNTAGAQVMWAVHFNNIVNPAVSVDFFTEVEPAATSTQALTLAPTGVVLAPDPPVTSVPEPSLFGLMAVVVGWALWKLVAGRGVEPRSAGYEPAVEPFY